MCVKTQPPLWERRGLVLTELQQWAIWVFPEHDRGTLQRVILNILFRCVSTVGDSLKGIWLQIQCGTYLLPDEKDKETAIDGTFFTDPVS